MPRQNDKPNNLLRLRENSQSRSILYAVRFDAYFACSIYAGGSGCYKRWDTLRLHSADHLRKRKDDGIFLPFSWCERMTHRRNCHTVNRHEKRIAGHWVTEGAVETDRMYIACLGQNGASILVGGCGIHMPYQRPVSLRACLLYMKWNKIRSSWRRDLWWHIHKSNCCRL